MAAPKVNLKENFADGDILYGIDLNQITAPTELAINTHADLIDDLDAYTSTTQSVIDTHIDDLDNPHEVTKVQVGLSNVTNDAQVKRTEMGVNSGVATLGADGKLLASQLPAVATITPTVVSSQSEMLALVAQPGDIAIRTDLNKSFILQAEPASALSNWIELLTPTDAVLSVNSKVGHVVLGADDILFADNDSFQDKYNSGELNGQEVELRNDGTYIQWKYTDDITWTNLEPLVNLVGAKGDKGDNGDEVMLQKSATHIQWKYTTDANWTDLVALDDLKGEQGEQGDPGYTPIKGVDYFDGLDINWKGTYSGGTSYVVNDAVSYLGSSYICKLTTIGNIPTNNTYWDLMAAKGDAGTSVGSLNDLTDVTLTTPSDCQVLKYVDGQWVNEDIKYAQGCHSIPSFTDNGNGTLTLGSAVYYLNTTSAGDGCIEEYTIAGATYSLTDNTQNYIVADYNNGTPIIYVTQNVDIINETTIIPIYSVFRNGNYLHTQNWDSLGNSLANKVHQSIVKTQRYRKESGLVLTESGTRNLNLTTGRVWTGAVPITLDAIATATDNMFLWYHNAGVWTQSVVSQYNNTQYDNGTNLATLNNGRYGVSWIFRGIENQKHLYCVLGTGNDTLAQAQAESVPSLPTVISSHALLVAKLIVQKSANTATSIQSAFDTVLSYSSVSDHANLANLQGGVAGEYYHLTSAELTKLGGIAAGAEVNVNADWNAVSGDAQILNKPTISGSNTGDQTMGTIAETTNNKIVRYIASADASDTYTATTPSYTAYAVGDMFALKVTTANTTGATLNVNSLGAKNIVRGTSTALVTGDITANKIVYLVYDGTSFQLLSQGVDSVSLSATQTLTNKTLTTPTLTTPRVASNGSINDASGNEYLKFVSVASATNDFTITNAINGSPPILGSSGSSDANVDLKLQPKGTGKVQVANALAVNGATLLTNSPFGIAGSVNSYLQSNMQNTSSSNSASGDLVVTADTGTDTTNFIDMGINSSTYNDSAFSILGALGSYLYNNGGDLAIGTSSATKVLKLFTGGTTSDKLRATVSDTGLNVVGALSENSSPVLISNNSTIKNVIALTKAGYDAIGTKDPNTLYNITDEYSSMIQVENNLTSTSISNPLSANQGRLLKSYIDIKNKKICIYKNGTQAITAGTVTEWTADTSLYSYDNSIFTFSAGRITIGSSRVKSVCVNGRFQASSPQTAIIIYICKNGNPISSVANNSSDVVSLSGFVECTSGDYISLKVYTSAGVNLTNNYQWNGLEVSVLETND